MKRSYYIVGGLIMILLGGFWLLRVLNVIPPEFTLFFDGWWTLFIIVPSIMGIIGAQDKTLPVLGLVLGVLLLLAAQGVISWATFGRLIVPALIVVIGIFLLVGGLASSKRRTKVSGKVVPPQTEIAATFSEQAANFAGRDFTGGAFTAVFGKVTVDLTNAMIAPESVISIYAVFGSVDIILPGNFRAAIRVIPVLGAAGDRRPNKPDKEAPAVNVEGTVMFGSVNIR